MEFRIPDFKTISEIHDIVIELYGGKSGVPHPELIESAIHRPESYMMYDRYCDIHLVSALIFYSIARYHAFADGNKRTALLAMLMTYNNNGIKISYGLHVNQKFEKFVLRIADDNPPTIRQIRARLKRLIEQYKEL